MASVAMDSLDVQLSESGSTDECDESVQPMEDHYHSDDDLTALNIHNPNHFTLLPWVWSDL